MKYSLTLLALAATAFADYPAPAPPAYPVSSPEPAYPAYPVKSEAPVNSYPAKTYPAETYPAETYPAKTYPAETYPVKTYEATSTSTPCETSTSANAGYPVKSPYPVAPVYPVYPSKNESVEYTTYVTTAVTTWCPYATEVVHGGKTYTVSEATTLTITDCPCTVTKPVWTPPTTTPCTTTAMAAPHTYAPAPAVETPCTTSTFAYSKYQPSGVAYPSGGKSTAAPIPYKQANGASANKVGAIVAGAVAGVVALAL